MVTIPHFVADISVRQSLPPRILQHVAGIVRHPFQSYLWLHFINTHPSLGGLKRLVPKLLRKIHQPYLSQRLDCAARVALLMRHYRIVQEAGFGKLARQAAVHPLRLCSIIGKSNTRYWLELSTAGDAHQDGEWILRLVSRNIHIYTVRFLFSAEQGEKQLMVGGLTGMLSMGRKMGIRQTTWDMYGWQPKDMMVSLALEIGTALGCSKAVLIGNRNKLPVADLRFCRKSSDYDKTWKELGATARQDGDFELPCTASQDALASRPRASRTKRSALIESVHLNVRNRLNAQRTLSAVIVPLRFPEEQRKRA